MCGQHVEPANFGLYNTFYKVTGYKRDYRGGPLRKVDEDWKFAGTDYYYTFNSNLVYWGQPQCRTRRFLRKFFGRCNDGPRPGQFVIQVRNPISPVKV